MVLVSVPWCARSASYPPLGARMMCLFRRSQPVEISEPESWSTLKPGAGSIFWKYWELSQAGGALAWPFWEMGLGNLGYRKCIGFFEWLWCWLTTFKCHCCVTQVNLSNIVSLLVLSYRSSLQPCHCFWRANIRIMPLTWSRKNEVSICKFISLLEL